MITNRWVFDDEYPATILHRNTELDALSRLLSPTQHGLGAENALIHGPSGVGKTASARWLLDNLRDEYGLEWSHIECSGKTRNGVLYEAVTKHSDGGVVHRNDPHGELLRAIEAAGGPYVVVLDEGDVVPDLDVLGDFLGARGVSVIAISHSDTEWLNRVGPDLRPEFRGDNAIEFRKYHLEGLVDILEPRVEAGLVGRPITDGQLEWIADETGGVARWAIKTILASAELALERNHDAILEDDIADGFGRAKRKMREDNLRSLPVTYQRLYELLRAIGPVSGSEMKQAYRNHKDAIFEGRRREVGWRQAQNYLSKMADYDLVEKPGETNAKQYSVVDDGLEAPVEFDPRETAEP
ncbi:Cdc6/Cdc18 family protein [Natrinema pallidum]|uniref:AAA family ATPase n=1 Tax=Natrinema pallidum TaxID=69527 RepID=A0A4P9TFW2_9EURY|nr:AAA family ATPase [Natrinema pallidum]QCW03587.1 AAA family ATPase [Natrinema pallidum]